MLNAALKSGEHNERDNLCDIRKWSAECEHSTYAYIGDKFLCDVCETIPGLDHEVRPATMPYVSGDYKRLS